MKRGALIGGLAGWLAGCTTTPSSYEECLLAGLQAVPNTADTVRALCADVFRKPRVLYRVTSEQLVCQPVTFDHEGLLATEQVRCKLSAAGQDDLALACWRGDSPPHARIATLQQDARGYVRTRTGGDTPDYWHDDLAACIARVADLEKTNAAAARPEARTQGEASTAGPDDGAPRRFEVRRDPAAPPAAAATHAPRHVPARHE